VRYQWPDTQLGGDVAVKVLPTTVSTDVERLRRFEQEACAARVDPLDEFVLQLVS
jgi:hypothetical protein